MEKRYRWIVAGVCSLVLLQAAPAFACIWDSDTLASEKRKSPKLAEVILGEPPKPPDPKPLLERIQKLKASPKEDSPAWWNDLAGAYLRLGRAQEATDLLEPVVQRFPDDYGIHANLGTAYHLLGRYAEAEKHISRNLQVNPEAHFGLEKYHLALLQYLMRDGTYRLKHLYVDEFSESFFKHMTIQLHRSNGETWQRRLDESPEFRAELEAHVAAELKAPGSVSAPDLCQAIWFLGAYDDPPAYTTLWNLGQDPKCADGVIYMAILNPGEPACFVGLAAVALKQGDRNLAVAAIRRAISLGSPQKTALLYKADALKAHISQARKAMWPIFGLLLLIPLLILAWIISVFRRKRTARLGRLQSKTGA